MHENKSDEIKSGHFLFFPNISLEIGQVFKESIPEKAFVTCLLFASWTNFINILYSGVPI